MSARSLLSALLSLAILATVARADEAALRVAVYDVPPYGHVEANGSVNGASVDLWRRVAEALGARYSLIPVTQMEAVLSGLEHGEFDVAVGAITITPERLARVDFSFPAHRSGVAAAFARDRGAFAAISDYFGTVAELGPLLAITMALLLAMGVGMWLVERANALHGHESAVSTLRDGVYWAVVTMTTVGYGDKTPKSAAGRVIAILWMLTSVALISILSTAIVSKMTAEQVSSRATIVESDLSGKRLTAVARSSGAEFLEARHMPFKAFDDLPSALRSVTAGEADAVVNSIGALQYAIRVGFEGKMARPEGVLEPAYLAFALPAGSALKKPLDRALAKITASADWRRAEDIYFAP